MTATMRVAMVKQGIAYAEQLCQVELVGTMLSLYHPDSFHDAYGSTSRNNPPEPGKVINLAGCKCCTPMIVNNGVHQAPHCSFELHENDGVHVYFFTLHTDPANSASLQYGAREHSSLRLRLGQGSR